MKIKLKIIKGKIFEKELAELINKSWLCIACISNYSYFVRKYIEISACNCLVIGDINEQGYNIIGSNMVYISPTTQIQQIQEKINYYLSNKEIIAALSFNKLPAIKNEDFEKYANKLVNICNAIKNNSDCDYQYHDNYDNKIMPNISHISEKINLEVINDLYDLLPGLYVVIFQNQNNRYNINVCDNSGIRLTDNNTFFVTNDYIYVPFKLHSSSKVKIITDNTAKAFQLRKITIQK